jgi:uncharacterized protein
MVAQCRPGRQHAPSGRVTRRMYLCQITYRRLNIGPAKTRKEEFLRFVPSGVATVAESQAKGFAYLKVG